MKVNIVYGPNTDKAVQDCYHYILKTYRKEKAVDSNLRKSIDRRAIEGVQHRRPD